MAQTKVTTSKKFNLNVSDWVRGLIVAVLTGPITIILDSLSAGSLQFDWKKILTVGLAAGLAYVVKNWAMTPNEITIRNAPAEDIKAVKQGDATAKVVSND